MPPEHHGLGWGPIVGGLLLGVGAWINRACMLGSISRIAEGDTNFLLTLAGLALALLAWPRLYLLPEEPSSYTIRNHALQPQFTTSIDFKVGDIGAWDTFATLHKATLLKPATGPDDRRLLWRISVNGFPPLLQREGPQS